MSPIVINFQGPIPSKKNMNRPNRGGKGLHQDKDLLLLLERLEMQVPGHCRDLCLESPEVEFQFYYAKANWDIDNAETTVIDILVKQRVIKNDNIRRFNGKRTTWPAIQRDYPGCTVTLIPTLTDSDRMESSPRYIQNRRRQSVLLASFGDASPTLQEEEFEPYVPEE